MEKKKYVKPLMEAIETVLPFQLLAGSGMQSVSEDFKIDFGGIDEEGIVIPQ
mgnify:CR=1 FL=1